MVEDDEDNPHIEDDEDEQDPSGTQQPAIHFNFPERPHVPPAPLVLDRDDLGSFEFEEEDEGWFVARLIATFFAWFRDKKDQWLVNKQAKPKARNMAEVPFLTATFSVIYGTYMLIRSLAIQGWIVDHTHWDGTGHAYDRNPLVYLGTLETIFMSTSVAFGICICVMLIARTRVHFYFASKWCQIFAYLQALSSLTTVLYFLDRVREITHENPDHVFSRGFWSCICGGVLVAIAAFGFTADWLLFYPYSDLSVVLQALVLPSTMTFGYVITGALTFMHLEHWTYNESLIFCWTAVTTIGYGDIAPVTNHGRIFFLFYTAAGVSIVTYLLLSIRAVISGKSSDIMKVNLMRVQSLRDYSHKQRQKWFDRQIQQQQQQRSSSRQLPLIRRPKRSLTETSTTSNPVAPAPPTVRQRSYSNASMLSTYTLSGLLGDKDRQIMVQVITHSGVLHMTVILLLSWFGGAALFCWLENDWSYLDGIYFAFVTQLTIGFGDVVPRTALAQEFWVLYIILSIAIAAYIISIIGEILVQKLQLEYDSDETASVASDPLEEEVPGYVALAQGLEDETDSVNVKPSSQPIQVSNGQAYRRTSISTSVPAGADAAGSSEELLFPDSQSLLMHQHRNQHRGYGSIR